MWQSKTFSEGRLSSRQGLVFGFVPFFPFAEVFSVLFFWAVWSCDQPSLRGQQPHIVTSDPRLPILTLSPEG